MSRLKYMHKDQLYDLHPAIPSEIKDGDMVLTAPLTLMQSLGIVEDKDAFLKHHKQQTYLVLHPAENQALPPADKDKEDDEQNLFAETPFNVRGVFPEFDCEPDYLLDTLTLGFKVCDWTTAKAYRIDKRLGLVLYWANNTETQETIHPFITEMTAEQIYPQVKAFLHAYYNKLLDIDLQPEDQPVLDDDEITNVKGYRVYTGQWGHVDEDGYAFLAIKPAYNNYGK